MGHNIFTPSNYLRTHNPVAVASAVAHFAPSGAPLAQTSDTNASSSAHRTVPVPVTTRKADAWPGSPFGPAGPGGPAGPCGPCAPICPAGPCAPVGPAGPCAPAGPGVGWPHPATASVAMIPKRLKSWRIESPPCDKGKCSRIGHGELGVPLTRIRASADTLAWKFAMLGGRLLTAKRSRHGCCFCDRSSLGKKPCTNNGDTLGFHKFNVAPFLRWFGLSGPR